MTEYKTERVDPSLEQWTHEVSATFCRQFIDAQEIYNESTEITSIDVHAYGDFIRSFTGNAGELRMHSRKNVTHYLAMRFSRETDMPDYLELTRPETTFNENMRTKKPKKPLKTTIIAAIALAIVLVSAIMALANGTSVAGWEIAICTCVIFYALPSSVIMWIRYAKQNKRFDAAIAAASDAFMRAEEITGKQ